MTSTEEFNTQVDRMASSPDSQPLSLALPLPDGPMNKVAMGTEMEVMCGLDKVDFLRLTWQ